MLMLPHPLPLPLPRTILVASNINRTTTLLLLRSILTTPPFHPLSTFPPPPPPPTHYKLNHKDWLSPTQVVKIFENLDDPEAAVSVWNQYTKRKDYKPNEPIYTAVINKLAAGKNFDEIEDLMERIKLERQCRLSESFFYTVIKIYGNVAGRYGKAVETLMDMPGGYKCWPSVKTFNLALNMLVSAKLFDEVRRVYVKAPVLGVEIDSCCLNIVIKGLCENGDLGGALYVLDEFPKQRCRPNARSFSTIMHALCDKGKVEEAFQLLERMEKEGVEADTVAFNILISGLRKQGRVQEGMELFERMEAKGCEPNDGSYQEVLYGLLDARKFVEAKQFMGRMVSRQVSPSFVAYKKLIHGLCKEKLLGEVDWVLKQMVKQGFVPRMGMWRQMVRSLVPRHNSCNHIDVSEIVGTQQTES